eukprot:COSAG01_NODE_2542_length_7472_cov_25.428455_2_plen_124_part_00
MGGLCVASLGADQPRGSAGGGWLWLLICYRGPQSDKSPYFFSSARNFPNFWRTITLAYYHYKLWGPLGIHYYRAGLPFIDTISHTSIVFSAFKNRVTVRGPFPQFQQHSNRIKKIEHYYSHIL